MEKKLRELWWFIRQLVLNPPLEWVNTEDGTVDETWNVSRLWIWRSMKPLWLIYLGSRRLPCGCHRRIKMVSYRMGCAKHFPSSVRAEEG